MTRTEGPRQLDSPESRILAFAIGEGVQSMNLTALTTALRAVAIRQDALRLLIIVDEFAVKKLEGYSFSFEDLHARVRAFGSIDRYGAVGAPYSEHAMIETMDMVLPIDARGFRLDQVPVAWAFVLQ